MKSRRRGIKASQVDLIPMIDIVFQLILFFLVSTTFAMLPAINVNLPQSQTAQGEKSAGLVITASEDGRLWLNETEVSFEALNTALASYDTNGMERIDFPVQLEADDLVTNGTIVRIFDVLRENGFSAVNLRTKK